ncbi:hypothetical protein BsWGS_28607 [Bradybaena similaris]
MPHINHFSPSLALYCPISCHNIQADERIITIQLHLINKREMSPTSHGQTLGEQFATYSVYSNFNLGFLHRHLCSCDVLPHPTLHFLAILGDREGLSKPPPPLHPPPTAVRSLLPSITLQGISWTGPPFRKLLVGPPMSVKSHGHVLPP